MPGWYQDLLISDELEGQFQIASIRFLIENRKDAEPVFRSNNRLRNMIEENYTRKDWETQIAELLKAILNRNDCTEEIFSYWFLGLFRKMVPSALIQLSCVLYETHNRKICSSLFFVDNSTRSGSSNFGCGSSGSCRQI